MKTSEEGKDLIKLFEGVRLKAYLCSAGVPTIGFGNTFYEDGKKVKMGDSITLERARTLFDMLLPKYEKIVLSKVKRGLKQNEFDALVCHTYNTGGSNTLFKLVQMDADKDKIKSWWLEKYTTANGKKLQGLVNRRKKEWELYNK